MGFLAADIKHVAEQNGYIAIVTETGKATIDIVLAPNCYGSNRACVEPSILVELFSNMIEKDSNWSILHDPDQPPIKRYQIWNTSTYIIVVFVITDPRVIQSAYIKGLRKAQALTWDTHKHKGRDSATAFMAHEAIKFYANENDMSEFALEPPKVGINELLKELEHISRRYASYEHNTIPELDIVMEQIRTLVEDAHIEIAFLNLHISYIDKHECYKDIRSNKPDHVPAYHDYVWNTYR